MDYTFTIDGKYYNTLEIESFSRMMESPSYCYKFYWLDAITTLITENCTHTTFNDIINEMIADAWYSVIEFHIHLSGIVYKDKDNLEKAVTLLQEHADLPSNASKTEIKNAIKTYDTFIHKEKKMLTNMVPYKALSGFFINHGMGPLDDSIGRMVEKIQSFHSKDALLPYTLGNRSGLDREVYFDEDWVKMIKDNRIAIKGWIKHEKIKWLQRNNPEIPSLIDKLESIGDKERKLYAVRNLWKGIFPYANIDDVFTQKPIDPDDYDIDHFIPFSFVMNDELWNLMPMDSSLNSVKSNNLPMWDDFFARFASNQFIMYELIHSKKDIFALYEKCYKDNLHSVWATQDLYRKGNKRDEFINILSNNMRPVYDSAYRQGYSVWKYRAPHYCLKEN